MPSRSIEPSEASSASPEAHTAAETYSPRDPFNLGAAAVTEPPPRRGAVRTLPAGRTKRFVRRDAHDLEVWAQVPGVVSER